MILFNNNSVGVGFDQFTGNKVDLRSVRLRLCVEHQITGWTDPAYDVTRTYRTRIMLVKIRNTNYSLEALNQLQAANGTGILTGADIFGPPLVSTQMEGYDWYKVIKDKWYTHQIVVGENGQGNGPQLMSFSNQQILFRWSKNFKKGCKVQINTDATYNTAAMTAQGKTTNKQIMLVAFSDLPIYVSTYLRGYVFSKFKDD